MRATRNASGFKPLRPLLALTVIAVASALGTAASAQTAPEVTLTRLDCGTPVDNDVGRFSDTFAYPPGHKVKFTYSCYLIKHGDDYLLWDTGHAMTAGAVAPKVSIVDQLAQLKLKPEQIKFVGISHYHADHTGQVASFPGSTLLIGKGDWDSITSPKPNPGTSTATFTHWISGGGKLEALPADKDVFGDGTAVILNTPGHTPGHHSLLVRLKEMGNVLITGDLAHFHENYDGNGVPSFNFHRGDTVASLDRFKKIAANLKATVIIQHDARDVSKLPAFPVAAK
jgi:glyoxylase-like metal-dependent hydrolase (beta-lactamase superfamily II)